MATYRTVYNSFWTDAKVVDDFTPEDRYFYLYVMTNPHTNIAGCYEISIKQMANELGYNSETVERLLKRFEDNHCLLRYDKQTKELLIKNWSKYNWSESPKVITAVRNCIKTVKSTNFKAFLECILNGDTVSENLDTLSGNLDTLSKSDDILEQRTVTENNNSNSIRANKDEDITAIVEMYNGICVSLPKCQRVTDKRKKKVSARLKEYSAEQIRTAFEKAEMSDFMSGRKGGWRASFDWFFESENNILKVLEGKYDNNKSSPKSPFAQAWMEIEGELNAGVSTNKQRGVGS